MNYSGGRRASLRNKGKSTESGNAGGPVPPTSDTFESFVGRNKPMKNLGS